MSFERLVSEALETPFGGWDWTVFSGRFVEHPTPWDERAVVARHLEGAGSLLDLGTGGGERLAGLDPLPPDTVATEGHPPNVPVARRRLAPLGIEVVEVAGDGRLPFEAGRFDLVVARHEAFDAHEVARVLRPGGTFVTQQVGGRDLHELNEVLGRGPHAYRHWDLATARAQIDAAGLEVTAAAEALLPATFHDVGAVVLFCRVTPWQVPGFSIAQDAPRLRTIHAVIEREGAWTAHIHRFLLVARRPA